MFCWNCGVEVSEQAVICVKCGVSLKKTQLAESSLQSAPGATASLVLGIIGLFFIPLIFGIIAIVLGAKAKKRIAQEPGVYAGGGKATAGIVLGIIDVSVMTVLWILCIIGMV